MLLIKNARLIDKNTDVKGAVLINGKKIAKIMTAAEAKAYEASAKKLDVVDAKGLVLMPSFVDMHAHFRDPGFTQKETIETGCMAAAAGGYGTVVLMPNTNPVVSSQKMAEENNAKAQATGLCRVIQSVSITENFDGKTVSHLKDIDSKVVPLITEDGHEVDSSAVMFKGMSVAAQKNMIVSCHCEDVSLAQSARVLRKRALEEMAAGEKKNAAAYFRNANDLLEIAEDVCTFRNIRLAQDAGCHVHLCHVSTAACIEAVRAARKNGQNVTCEITPHHIGLEGTKAPNIFQIVNPPLRCEEDRQALIKALADGTADAIATDHAPHTAEDKAGGSPGFSGIETSFAVCNTTLVQSKVMNLKKLSALMSANPAQILGLKKIGLLEEGYEADVVLVDPKMVWRVQGEKFYSKGKYTPLEGRQITGRVIKTWYLGKEVFSLEK